MTNEEVISMERLTVPDKRIDGGMRRAVIDTRAVRAEAMTIYWRLKKYEDTGLTPEEILEGKLLTGWIPVEERLPTKNEYLENDGRFILDDGNRRYQGVFDVYDGKFKFVHHISGLNYELFEDRCVLAWMPLPEPYKEGGK